MRRHSLLGIALAILLVWLLFVVIGHILSWAIHLLWILILIALVWWAVRVFFGRRHRREW